MLIFHGNQISLRTFKETVTGFPEIQVHPWLFISSGEHYEEK